MRSRLKLRFAAASIWTFSQAALSAEITTEREIVEQVEPPAPSSAIAPGAHSDETVSSRLEGEVKIEEFRRKGGQVYLVRITPKNGAPYYLANPRVPESVVDHAHSTGAQSTPAWIIKSW
jgi:hypothetical protein